MPRELDQIKNRKKSALHMHMYGSFPLWYLRQIAVDPTSQAALAELEAGIKVLANSVPYHDAFKYFEPVRKIVKTKEQITAGVVAIAQDLLEDNVVYAELRSGLKDLGGGLEQYLLAILAGIEQSPAEITIKLILSLRRDTSLEVAWETIYLAEKFRDAGIVGIDISGDSMQGNIELIMPALLYAKSIGLKITLHLGETYEEIDTPSKAAAQLRVLEQLQPDRIGHGVFLSAQAEDWILRHRVPIEVCPSSSVLAGMISSGDTHPGIKHFLLKNHPIVVDSDDKLLFDTSVSEELAIIMQAEGLTMAQIDQLIAWSFEYSFSNNLRQRQVQKLRATL